MLKTHSRINLLFLNTGVAQIFRKFVGDPSQIQPKIPAKTPRNLCNKKKTISILTTRWGKWGHESDPSRVNPLPESGRMMQIDVDQKQAQCVFL